MPCNRNCGEFVSSNDGIHKEIARSLRFFTNDLTSVMVETLWCVLKLWRLNRIPLFYFLVYIFVTARQNIFKVKQHLPRTVLGHSETLPWLGKQVKPLILAVNHRSSTVAKGSQKTKNLTSLAKGYFTELLSFWVQTGHPCKIWELCFQIDSGSKKSTLVESN